MSGGDNDDLLVVAARAVLAALVALLAVWACWLLTLA